MTVVATRVPVRAPGLELLGELRDSGYTTRRYVVRRADGQIVQVTPLLYCLLEAVDGRRDIVGLAEEASGACGKLVGPEHVEFLLDERLAPMGLLCDRNGDAPRQPKQVPLLALRGKVVVSDPSVTRRVTAPFAALFRSSIVVPVLAAFAVATWWVLFEHGLASGTRQAFDSPGLLLGAFALILVSAGWHEFGHAAACRAAGAAPGAMGAGLYMVWPAFYTDVDDSRRLDRWGRLKVDLGGLYFNAVAAVAVMAVWLVLRMDALLLVVAAQLLLMVRQVVPVIRADGYHILADIVGVPDLFQHIRPTLAGMLPTQWGKPQPLRPWARWTVRLWVLVTLPLMVLLLLGAVLLFPRLVATSWMGAARQGRAMADSFGDGDVLGLAAALLNTASLVVPVAAVAYMVVRVTRRGARRVWSGTDGRPAARAFVVAAAALSLAFLLLAWWPAGQYDPVSAGEGGTVPQLVDMRSGASPAAAQFEPIAGVTPVSGYALVPRDGSAPAVLLVEGPDGTLRTIVTHDGSDATGVAFPFTLPDLPGDGDNQALAVNTEDGAVVYDIAVVLVWVRDGGPVDNRNEAYALASCTGCSTVAVSFQVVLVVGESDMVVPVNIAAAGNGGCISCQTAALAVQLVVTLSEMPSEELEAELDEALAQLEGVDLSELGNVYAAIKAVETEMLTLLDEAGLIPEGTFLESTTASTSDTTNSTTSTTTSSSSTSTSSTDSTTTSSSSTSTSSTDSTTTSTTSSTTTTTTSTTTAAEPSG